MPAHSYAQRWSEADADPELAELEQRLADDPPIRVPTIVLHGQQDGGTLVNAAAHQERFFTAGYERRTLPAVGHFVPREAPTTRPPRSSNWYRPASRPLRLLRRSRSPAVSPTVAGEGAASG